MQRSFIHYGVVPTVDKFLLCIKILNKFDKDTFFLMKTIFFDYHFKLIKITLYLYV